jgi:MFS family permease
LRHRDFRLLWSAEFISSLGNRIQQMAIGWHVFELTGDPFQLGLLGLCRFAPILLFGIPGGVVADRSDRRRTLLLSQGALLACSAVLAGLTLSGSISLITIYLITALSATFGTVAGPTRQALIPTLVPRASLTGAVTLTILTGEVAAISGPAIGGLLIAGPGLGFAYAVDAVSFGVVIVALLLVRTRLAPLPTARGGRAALASALEGLRFLGRSPVLLGVMSLDFVATFFGASTVLMPIFAVDVLGTGPAGLGLLLAAPAAGAVAAGAIMGVSRTPRRPGVGVLIAVAAYGACILGFGLSHSLWWSLAFLAGSGAADASSMALRHALRTLVTPDGLRGRVAAAHSTFATGGPQLGEFEAGVVASFLGAGTAVALGGLGTLLAVGVVAWRVPAIAAFSLARPDQTEPGAAEEGRPDGERATALPGKATR